ncbi:MAG: type IV pilus assembly protein PilM [Luteitalea sp.]|nr:type IV pilus assembly protein PilM [Luteitalea sp.]
MWWRTRRQVVGLDIGASAVRLLELRRRGGGVSVRACGSAPLPDHSMAEGDLVDESAIVACLEPLVATLPLSTRRVAIGLAGREVFVTRLLLPRLTRRELRAAIRWEARAHLPFDVDEVALDYHALTDDGRDGSQMVVVLAAARLTTIERWRSLVARAGLRLTIVDVVPFALQRACEWLGVIAADEVVLLVHIGARATATCLVRGGDALFVRDLAIGGEAWTTELAREAGCARPEAEARKQTRPFENGCASGHTNWAAALAVATESFTAELVRTLVFAREHGGMPTPQRVVLSGGGARLHGLDAAVAARLNCPLDVFDLAEAPIVGARAGSGGVGVSELGPAWAVAMGLALRGVSR